MKQVLIIVASLVAGFTGGIVGPRVIPGYPQSRAEQVIRARSFELVDDAGKAISFWGVDESENAVLVFGSHWPKGLPQPSGLPKQSLLGLKDRRNQRAAIGVIDEYPFLRFNGEDGKTRLRMYLSEYGKPVLLMDDETGPRLSLGIEQGDTPNAGDSDWSLAFYPERARIGMYTVKEQGRTYVRGSLGVNKDKVMYPEKQ